ncbi:carbohydrate kinase domain-containing protein [Capsaspora owczarzaki ATCC 30864]|uniref:ATP-dependent (S)-NAD(P)H-hydrate dehydratase n=1 Tax=Capsaspora owczarzaki (strain ATCC 30864) TaxID=595528 RepID=A0A0D2WJJ2_CAPO3|nr:carbohydrate kinase domain-containing protein [Capsaspora owczarzaki ATCC 30864]KJE89538.1 carbohydrate kinase domain-containing protein [Capsaspora owczarzaki ATCC 30864]|eukprot:XP_004365858.1 carbohydrate kinase domain-containing protein [Capsaspora owczarzaki ATCC 30864]
MANRQLLMSFARCIPELSSARYKGQAGKVAVIGGSKEYTGAPYFAGIAALKAGADIVHVFSPEAAAMVIKTYSPELIVHPTLTTSTEHKDLDAAVSAVGSWLERLHVVVVGPGLGRDAANWRQTEALIERARKLDLPLIVDADALRLVAEKPDLVKGYRKATLTPNRNELDALFKAVLTDYKPLPDDAPETSHVELLRKLCKALGHVTVVRKGVTDVISDGDTTLSVSDEGNKRRCGGQGDVLTGILATFTYWAHQHASNSQGDKSSSSEGGDLEPNLLAANFACRYARACGKLAFEKAGRSTTAVDVIAEMNPAFEELFGQALSQLVDKAQA